MLYDFLRRLHEAAAEPQVFAHHAERRVLWDLECALETVLGEPLSPDYRDALGRARDRIRDANE